MNKAAIDIMKSLGLPTERCTGLTLKFHPIGSLDVTATYAVFQDGETSSIAESIQKYQFIEKGPTHET